MTLTAATGKSLEGDQTRAELRFNTVAAFSEIAPLRPTDMV